jgi:hypothetical protein
MFPLVELPTLVAHYAPHFADVFSEAAFIQFQRYISGLVVSENKTIEGINRLVVHESRHQSSLNRLLTETPFSLGELNQARLNLLGSQPKMAMKPYGVLSLDNTLLKHYGQQFEQIAYLYDHVEERYVWAHDLLTLHYSDDQTDYPVLFQLWKPPDLEKLEQGLLKAGISLRASKYALKESEPHKWRNYLLGVWRRKQNKPGVAELYESKFRLSEGLLQQWKQAYPELDLPVTFDSWFTQPGFCHFLDQELGMAYVGTLTNSDELVLATGHQRLDAFAERLKQEHLLKVEEGKAPIFQKITIRYKGEKESYYSYCRSHRLHNFGKLRLVINYRQADLSDNPVFYCSNRRHWQALGITRIRRHRWPVEVYHQEGKAEGLDQYQVRDFAAIERHVALVAVVYSLLRTAQHDPDLQDKLQRQLQLKLDGSVPFWRRTTQAQSLWNLALFISAGLAQGQTLQTIMAPLLKAMCAV